MAYIKIDKEKCKGCELCAVYCTSNLITCSGILNKKGIRVAGFNDKGNKCTGCSTCAIICPDCAIEVWR